MVVGSTSRTLRGCNPGSRSMLPFNNWQRQKKPYEPVLCPGTPWGQIPLLRSPEHRVEGTVLPRLHFVPTLACLLVLTGTEVEFFSTRTR